MNLKPFFLFTLCTIGTSVLAGGTVLPLKNDVEIDAQNKEWHSPLPRYDKNTGINFDAANNSRNLYLILRVADETIQRQIMQNGLEVWINMDGKKKKTTGVTFPMPKAAGKPGNGTGRPSAEGEGMPSEMPAQGNAQNSTQNKRQGMSASGTDMGMTFLSGELTLTGFLIDNGKQPTKNCPVRVALAKDASNCMVYELAIPFNTFYKENLGPEDAATKCCIGFVVKAPATTSNEESPEMGMSGGMGGGPGGMGGGPGGGMGGGPGGMGGGPEGMSGMQSSTTTNKTFWFKTQLSIQ
jgi:hypothetical protein